jgi:hypothetical protein
MITQPQQPDYCYMSVPGITQDSPVTIYNIRDIICKEFGISEEEIASESRKKDIVYPRQVAIFLMCMCPGRVKNSLKKIGAILGDRDHTTVIHSRDKIWDLLENDETVRYDIGRLYRQLFDAEFYLPKVKSFPKPYAVIEPTERPKAEYLNKKFA